MFRRVHRYLVGGSAPVVASTNLSSKDAHLELRQYPVRLRWLNSGLVAIWIFAFAAALYLNRGFLFAAFDGGFVEVLSKRFVREHVPIFTSAMDFFEGLGDIEFFVNFNAFPIFHVLSAIPDETIAKVATYLWGTAELQIGYLVFASALGMRSRSILIGCLLYPILVMPIYKYGLVFSNIWLSPQNMTLYAAAMGISGLFIRVGRRGLVTSALLVCGLAVLVVWFMCASMINLILPTPFILLSVFSSTLACQTRREFAWKIACAVVLIAALVALGPALYLVSVVSDTAAALFPTELVNDRANLYFTSILFHGSTVGLAGPALVLSSMGGAVLAFVSHKPGAWAIQRVFGAVMFSYFASRMLFAIATIMFDFWRGPSPIYFELYVLPLYVCFSAYLLDRIVTFVAGSLRDNLLEPAIWLSIAIVAVLALALDSPPATFPVGPLSKARITAYLADRIALSPGQPFRGRAATFTGRAIDGPITWFDLHDVDNRLRTFLGNEFRLQGYERFGIPHFFSYSSTATPAFYIFTTRLLARPDDGQVRSVSVLRTIRPRLLAMLGVRYIVTDAPFEGDATLAATEPGGKVMLYLYELNDTNVGDYSPTRIHRAADVTDTLRTLADQDFDPRQQVVTFGDDDVSGLVPVTDSRLEFEGPRLRLQAHSTGRSMVVLPLEYSKCLEASVSEGALPTLRRVNLIETGIVFSGDLDTTLSLRTGPFTQPTCRWQDRAEMIDLGIEKAGRAMPLEHASR